MAPSSGSLIAELQLMRLHTIWHGWLYASFANQITLFAVSLTLGVSLLIGAGSYLALRAQIETALESGLAAQATLVESRLSHSILQASAGLDALSRNSFIVNGLVDSLGRDTYLQPFLRDFRLFIPGNEDTPLILYDFGGKPLIQIRPDKAAAADTEVVGQAIATDKPQVRIITQGNETYLKLVQPIHFPPTQSVEGALAVRIQLTPLLANTGIALAEGQVLQLHAAGAVVAQSGASRQDVLRVERALKLAAPFDTLRLRLTLDSSMRDAHGPLNRLTLIYGVGILLLLPLVGWLAHRSSRRLVAPLVQLSATTDAIARSGVITLPLQIGGPNEVGRLADAFDRMLARLGATQARFTNIVNLAADAIISVDEDQRILIFNYGAEQIFGYTAAEMLGQPLDRLMPERYTEAHRGHIRQFGTEPENSRKMSKRQDIVGRRKDGSEFPAEASISQVMENGKQVFTVFLRDISARKQAETALRESEEVFRRLFEDTHDPTLLLKNGCFIECNAATLKLLGYGAKSEILNHSPSKVSPAYQPDGRSSDEKAAEMIAIGLREGHHRFEWIHARADGSTIPCEVTLTPITVGGEVILHAFVRDITEPKQAEEEIRQLHINLERRVLERTTELVAVNKELEAFSYSVSHDLRAPLRSINGFSQALLEDYAERLDDQARDYLNRVRAATQRMGLLIDDMLTLSRVARIEMKRETVDLSALAADVLAELQKSEPGRKVDCRIESGLVAQGDAQLLRVVLDNLLGNAWKFTGKTANAQIEFGALNNAPIPNTGGAPGFFVRDNGAGFNMAYADKLFGAFQRLHLVGDFPGSGIGLATVQRVIHRHGGRVWAEGAVGEGATFYLSL